MSVKHHQLSRRERQIMDVIFARGEATAADVAAALPKRATSSGMAGFGIFGAALALALCSVAQPLGAENKTEAASPKFKGPMITIEAKFFEIESDSPEALAAMPWLENPMGNRPAVPMVQGVLSKEQAGDLLNALNAVKGVDLLSTPRVTSYPGQQVVIEIVREFRYPTEWKRDEKTGGWEPAAFESKNTGVTLAVLADRTEHDSLELMLTPKIVEFMGYRDLDAADGKVTGAPDPQQPLVERTQQMDPNQVMPAGHRAQPIFSTRRMDTQVLVWPDQSVLLELGAPDMAPGTKRRLFVLVTASVAKPEPEQAAAAHEQAPH